MNRAISSPKPPMATSPTPQKNRTRARTRPSRSNKAQVTGTSTATVRINKLIRAAKINCRNVQVGTLNDRVTLRGWVNTDDERRRIGDIAIAASRLELVDNQIMVGKPVTRNVLEPAVRRSLTG